MAEIGSLFVKIASKFDPKGMTDAKNQMQKLGGWVKKNSAQFKKLALAGAAMGAAVTYAALKAAKAAGVQQQAEYTLGEAMKVAGTYTEEAHRHNLEYASSLQKMTTYGDETILTVQKMLTNFGVEGPLLDKLTEATLDLAAAKGMDLKAAGDLVAKSVGSSTNALTRYGITVEGAVGSTERMQMAADNITKLFGGAAKAQAETYLGKIEQMKNRWGDLVEKVGFKVIPIVEELMDVVEIKVLPLLENWMSQTGDTKSITEEFAKAILFVARSALGFVGALDIAHKAVKIFGTTQDGRLTITKKGWRDLQDTILKHGALLESLSLDEIKRTKTTGKKKEDFEAEMVARRAARLAERAERERLLKEAQDKKEVEAERAKAEELWKLQQESVEADIQQTLDMTNLTLDQQRIRLETAQDTYKKDTKAYKAYAKAILKIEGDKIAKMLEGAQKWSNAVMSGIQKVADTEKLTWKSGTAAFKEALKERLRQFVLESIQEIIVAKLKNLAKAIMNATVTWGFAAYQIGAVLAAAAVGIAGLRAIKSFDMPGIVPGPIGKPVIIQALGGEKFGGRESIGGPSIVVNVTGNTILDDAQAEHLADVISEKIHDRVKEQRSI